MTEAFASSIDPDLEYQIIRVMQGLTIAMCHHEAKILAGRQKGVPITAALEYLSRHPRAPIRIVAVETGCSYETARRAKKAAQVAHSASAAGG